MDVNAALIVPALLLNAASITVLVFGIYLRRNRRRDQAVAYYALNLSLFVVAAALTVSSSLTIGVGFGLFAVLSIVRLRSDEVTWIEIGYTMVSLVLGLVTGLPGIPLSLKSLMAVLLVGTLAIVEHPALIRDTRYLNQRVELERIITDREELRDHLSDRLGLDVHSIHIINTDFIRETMRIDIRASLPRTARVTRPAAASSE
jgi:hypothetical protein